MRRILAAFTAAGLAIALLVLASGGTLLRTHAAEPPPTPLPGAEGRAERVILIVVDGLTAEGAWDPAIMPTVAALPGRGMARVQHLLPSSISGIRAMAEGVVAAPASILFDFTAPAAAGGGVIQAVHAAGGETFVAGPRLWSDLYGRWLHGFVAGGPEPQEDAQLLTATLDAMATDAALIVLHLGAPDWIGHRYGSDSPQYRQALALSDRAVGAVLSRVNERTAVIVTSDHGLTPRGGHAGGEAAVVHTPLAWIGPGLPVGNAGVLRQVDVPAIIATALGVELPATPVEATRPHSWLWWGVAAVGLVAIVGVMYALASSGAVVVALGFGIVLAAARMTDDAGVLLACVAAAWAIVLWKMRRRLGPVLESAARCVHPSVMAACFTGAIVLLAIDVPSAAVLPLGVAVGAALAGVGVTAARPAGAVAAGATAIATLPAILLLLGETASLSSVRVHFAVEALAWPAGGVWAALLVLAAQAAPGCGLALGAWRVLREGGVARVGGFAAGAAICVVGQALAACVMLATADDAAQATALGVLLRSAGEMAFVLLPLALLMGLSALPAHARSWRPTRTRAVTLWPRPVLPNGQLAQD